MKNKIIKKGWGHEEIWASNELYCSKFLHFNLNSKSSLHFHKNKHESWYFLDGEFKVTYMDLKNARQWSLNYSKGDCAIIPPMLPHQVSCIQKGTIIEVSTCDSPDDNYRIQPGDSQK